MVGLNSDTPAPGTYSVVAQAGGSSRAMRCFPTRSSPSAAFSKDPRVCTLGGGMGIKSKCVALFLALAAPRWSSCRAWSAVLTLRSVLLLATRHSSRNADRVRCLCRADVSLRLWCVCKVLTKRMVVRQVRYDDIRVTPFRDWH